MKREDVARCIGICCLIWMGPYRPAEGITKCIQYALSYFGQAERRPEELYCYIGPPLPESFETYGGLSREEALLAVEKYRERFREKGMFENKVYPGVEKPLWS